MHDLRNLAIPSGALCVRDMGMLSWKCVVAHDHPLAAPEGPLSDDAAQLAVAGAGGYLALVAKTYYRFLITSGGVVAPDWESSATCLSAGLCVAMVPVHFALSRESIPVNGSS